MSHAEEVLRFSSHFTALHVGSFRLPRRNPAGHRNPAILDRTPLVSSLDTVIFSFSKLCSSFFRINPQGARTSTQSTHTHTQTQLTHTHSRRRQLGKKHVLSGRMLRNLCESCCCRKEAKHISTDTLRKATRAGDMAHTQSVRLQLVQKGCIWEASWCACALSPPLPRSAKTYETPDETTQPVWRWSSAAGLRLREVVTEEMVDALF